MFTVFNAIEEFFNNILRGIIEYCLNIMFTDINNGTAQVTLFARTGPQITYPEILDMLTAIQEQVLLPIASVILTFVITYELLSMVMAKNNMHDFGSFMFFQFFVKACISVLLLTHCREITMAIFEVGTYVAEQTGAVIVSEANLSIDSMIDVYTNSLLSMSTAQLYMTSVYCIIATVVFKILAILLAVVAFGRIVEVYLMISIAPITFATLGNKELGNIGITYIKGLFALAFQGFFMLVCVAIYAALVASTTVTNDLNATICTMIGMGVVLCFSLFKTSSLSKQIFNVH